MSRLTSSIPKIIAFLVVIWLAIAIRIYIDNTKSPSIFNAISLGLLGSDTSGDVPEEAVRVQKGDHSELDNSGREKVIAEVESVKAKHKRDVNNVVESPHKGEDIKLKNKPAVAVVESPHKGGDIKQKNKPAVAVSTPKKETKPVAYGQIRSLGNGGNICLDAPSSKKDLPKAIGLYPCHNQGGNQFFTLSKTGEIHRDEACLDYAGTEVMFYPCHGSKGNQFWIYNADSSQIGHNLTKKCLAINEKKGTVVMEQCVSNRAWQKWHLQNYDPSKL